MKLSQFKFKLPEEQLAQFPTLYREDARMLVLHRHTGEIEHRQVKNVVDYFSEGDLFVFNNTRVFPARLYGKKEKTLAPIEVFLLRELQHEHRFWDVLVEPARKIRIGNKLFFDDDSNIVAEVIDNTTSRGRTFRFLTDYNNDEFVDKLYALGTTPTPNYIRRPLKPELEQAFRQEFMLEEGEDVNEAVRQMDVDRYQSIFATEIGAVSAPASNLHFSKQLVKRMEINGIEHAFLTSHVSLGNFKEIEVEDLTKHKVDLEQIILQKPLVEAFNNAHRQHKRICAVGTEIIRALEHVVGTNGEIKEFNGWTNKFIYPPYTFTSANAFFVNFYMPESAQLMMVCAFGGYDEVMNAYKTALKEGYKFGDYGDAMLIVD